MVAYTFYEHDNRVMRYAETLAARGDHVDVIAIRHPGQSRAETLHEVDVFRIQTRTRNEHRQWTYLLRILLFTLRATFILSYWHIRCPYHLIHVHSVPDFLVFTAWVPKLCGVPLILDIHDILPELYASKFKQDESTLIFKALVLAERVSVRFADHIIVANHLWRNTLTERCVEPDKCTALINAPDPDIFTRGPRLRDDRKFVILYPGSLNRHQGVDLAIRAVARICSSLPQVEFHIYGDGAAKEELVELVVSLGVTHNVHILEPVPLRDIVDKLRNADLGIVPKRADSFGTQAFSTKVLEFMSMGVPVILSSTKIDRFYFDDTVATFFKSGDEDSLVDQLQFLISNPDMRTAQAMRAHAFVQHMTWDVYKAEYISLLSRLLSRSPRCIPEEATAPAKHT